MHTKQRLLHKKIANTKGLWKGSTRKRPRGQAIERLDRVAFVSTSRTLGREEGDSK